MFDSKKQKMTGPKTKMEKAVAQRHQQGRGPLDDWDMFANVMATRNRLPVNHPSHLALVDVTRATSVDVHRATNLSLPDRFAIRDDHKHASTSGGYKNKLEYKKTRLKMGKNYGQSALDSVTQRENTDPFRKFVRTIGHEMTHVEQRNQPQWRKHQVSSRELSAYGDEIASHPRLPALQGHELLATASKFGAAVRKSGRLTSTEKALRDSVQARLKARKGVGL